MKAYPLNERVQAAASQSDFQTVRVVNQPLTLHSPVCVCVRVCPGDGGLFRLIEIVIV